MAAVYEAENIAIGKRIAVKVLAAELITSRIVRERFQREARATAAVRSPYICDVYDVGEFDGRPFLVMELLEGESLYDRMTRVRRLDIELTLRIITQTAKGLAKAHSSNIVHRDLKPENLFLIKNEDGELITKLLDFGLAKFYAPTGGTAEQARLTREGALFGTPAYMSPEQAKGRGEVDHRSDLWALGCIVYECLSGQTVWNVDQGVAMILAQVASAAVPLPSKLMPHLPPTFDEWFLKALARDPDDRFQTARDFAHTLAIALAPASESALLLDDDTASPSRVNLASPVSSSLNLPGPLTPVAPLLPGSTPGTVGAGLPSHTDHIPPELVGRSRTSRSVLALFGLAAVTAATLYGYRHLGIGTGPLGSAKASAPSASSPDGLTANAPLERAPFVAALGRAQRAIAGGNGDQALTELDSAVRSGGEGLAINLRSHLRAALENTGPCKLTALGRPRPFDVTDHASRPSIATTNAGVIVSWVDGHDDKTRRQAFTTLLDANLQRASAVRNVAPESMNARFPQLLPAGDRMVLLYWDGLAAEPGVFVRQLDAEGRITGPVRRVAPVGRGEYSPTLARAEDGTYWTVWEDDATDGAENLLARHLDAGLSPIGNTIRLTSLRPNRNGRPAAYKPSLAISHGHVHVVFTLRKGTSRRVYLLQLPLTSPELQSGVALRPGKAPLKDTFVGHVRALGREGSSSDDARVSCTKDACIAVWADDKDGIAAAYLEPQTGESLWRREIAPRGTKPSLATTPLVGAVAYYENSRLRLATVTRDGVSAASTLGKVSGIQPNPELVPSARANEWMMAWRDYESGHFEAVVARATCRNPGQ